MTKVSPWLVRFIDKDVEHAYRVQHLPTDAKQTRFMAYIIIALTLVFTHNDLTLFELSPTLVFLFGLRAAIIVASLGFILALPRIQRHTTYDAVVLSYIVFVAAAVLAINSTREDYYLGHILSDYIFLLVIYFLPKLRLLLLMATPLAFSLICWLSLRAQLAHIDVLGYSAIIGFIVINVIGIFNNRQWQLIRRKQYTNEQEREALTNELLLTANTDPLTGCANRRKGMDIIEQEWLRYERYQNNFSFAIIDLDHFKDINDRYGHQAGDEVLVDFVKIVQQEIRSQDTLCRIGGEEFAIILPETDKNEAVIIANRIRERCVTQPTNYHGITINYTVSIGLTQIEPGDKGVTDIYGRADLHLYCAKAQGRNRVSLRDLEDNINSPLELEGMY